jgi:hypothetical protein
MMPGRNADTGAVEATAPFTPRCGRENSPLLRRKRFRAKGFSRCWRPSAQRSAPAVQRMVAGSEFGPGVGPISPPRSFRGARTRVLKERVRC